MNPRIAITCGDSAGVGPQVCLRWLETHRNEAADLLPIGPQRWLDSLKMDGIAVGPKEHNLTPGVPSKQSAQVAWDALEVAAAGCANGDFCAVVTGPISKSRMNEIGFNFPGQTEFFAARWGGEPTMAFAGGKLAVVLATWHIPLRDVPQAITKETLRRAIERADFLARALGAKTPRIAVCGLNPHAGEDGLLGQEEQLLINPVLDELRKTYKNLSPALPPDTVFRRQLEGQFDVIVSLYHDQGLAPLKAVDFDAAANLTLGLPFIRTSPDHGTAFEIAGKNTARPDSFASAIKMARLLAQAL